MKNARLKDLHVTERPDPNGTVWLLSFGAPEFTGALAIEIDEVLAKTILNLQRWPEVGAFAICVFNGTEWVYHSELEAFKQELLSKIKN